MSAHSKMTDLYKGNFFLELGYRNSSYLLRELEDIKSIRIFVKSRHCLLADVADQGSGNIPHFLYVI